MAKLRINFFLKIKRCSTAKPLELLINAKSFVQNVTVKNEYEDKRNLEYFDCMCIRNKRRS